jgi:hypothetical protein
MEAARISETSVDNHFTRQYNPEDSSEHNNTRLGRQITEISLPYIFLDKEYNFKISTLKTKKKMVFKGNLIIALKLNQKVG